MSHEPDMPHSETLLRPIEMVGRNQYRAKIVLYECRCGARKAILENNVKNGNTRSCGCLQHQHLMEVNARKITHGESRGRVHTAEYAAWLNMMDRCINPENVNFKNYGGRRISVCERWRTLKNFLADMGRRPSPELSLDRINNDGNYEPANCRWATRKEQANNRRNNKLVLR